MTNGTTWAQQILERRKALETQQDELLRQVEHLVEHLGAKFFNGKTGRFAFRAVTRGEEGGYVVDPKVTAAPEKAISFDGSEYLLGLSCHFTMYDASQAACVLVLDAKTGGFDVRVCKPNGDEIYSGSVSSSLLSSYTDLLEPMGAFFLDNAWRLPRSPLPLPPKLPRGPAESTWPTGTTNKPRQTRRAAGAKGGGWPRQKSCTSCALLVVAPGT